MLAAAPKKLRKLSDISLLKAIPNPSRDGYEIKIKNPEITFLGVYNQPDYATAYITVYPGNTVIELKSLKMYFQQFRQKIMSYERLINVVYNDLKEVYKPRRIRIVIETSPRGGLSSKLTIDSDWAIRGGKEEFKDWTGQTDIW